MEALRSERLSKNFGGVQALKDVSFLMGPEKPHCLTCSMDRKNQPPVTYISLARILRIYLHIAVPISGRAALFN
jgi:hypothetical protein